MGQKQNPVYQREDGDNGVKNEIGKLHLELADFYPRHTEILPGQQSPIANHGDGNVQCQGQVETTSGMGHRAVNAVSPDLDHCLDRQSGKQQ